MFTVHLQDNSKWQLPIETFRQLFPECIWISALEMSTDTAITCENPAVSERILQLLQRMCRDSSYGCLETTIPPEEYRAAHRYLNIPIFACMAYPEYERYWFYGQEMELRRVTLAQYQGYMTFTLNAQTLAVMEYVWAKIPASETVDIDRHALITAVKTSQTALVEGLFRRGLSPLTEHKCESCKYNALLTADRLGYQEILAMMVPRLRPEICVEYVPLIKRAHVLLKHPGLETEHLLNIVKLLTDEQLLGLTPILIMHPKMTRSILERFNFLQGIHVRDLKTFLDSKLSRAEDLPILLLRCSLDVKSGGLEIILQDSRITRTMVMFMVRHFLGKRRSADLLIVDYYFDQWLEMHPI